MTKAILIDAESRTIKEVKIFDPSNTRSQLETIYQHLGCDTIEAVYFEDVPEGDVGYVDEEGLYNNPGYQWIGFKGFPRPIMKKMLIVGTDANGNTVSPKMTLKEVKDKVYWCERLTNQLWGVVKYGKKKTVIGDLNAIERMMML